MAYADCFQKEKKYNFISLLFYLWYRLLCDVLRSNYRRIVLIKSIENVYYDVIKYLVD